MRVLDWLGRTLLLVMAGLATLSIVASVASVSNIHGTAPDRADMRSIAEPTQAPQPEPGERADPGERASPTDPVAADDQSGVLAALSAADAEDAEIARWLESLTYAVLALAGFMAAALLVLLRITALLARIAERRQD